MDEVYPNFDRVLCSNLLSVPFSLCILRAGRNMIINLGRRSWSETRNHLSQNLYCRLPVKTDSKTTRKSIFTRLKMLETKFFDPPHIYSVEPLGLVKLYFLSQFGHAIGRISKTSLIDTYFRILFFKKGTFLIILSTTSLTTLSLFLRPKVLPKQK